MKRYKLIDVNTRGKCIQGVIIHVLHCKTQKESVVQLLQKLEAYRIFYPMKEAQEQHYINQKVNLI